MAAWRVARLRLLLLRGFDLTFDGASIVLSTGAQRVLAFLALNDRPLHRVYVSGVLWPDTSERRASGSLRSALWDLRTPGHPLIEVTGRCLRLADEVAVDLRYALVVAEGVSDRRSPCPGEELERDLLRGDLLSDWYDDWVLFERERFRQARLHLLEALCERLVDEGQTSRAVQAGLAGVAGEPLRESAQRALINAYLAEGNRVEAVRQLAAYRSLLQDELGIAPSLELEAQVGGSGLGW